MTWRLQVRHQTTYTYADAVLASYNEVRMTPITDLRQTTISANISTDPGTTLHRYWDYWGTQVVAFDLHDPHSSLSITSEAIVETEPAPPASAEATWDAVRSPAVADELAELLAASTYVPYEEELAAKAQELAAGATPSDAVRAVSRWVHEALEYQPGITGVHTSAVEALRVGRGVCQDYAHLALVLLRSLGIPSRYVSGYLHPVADAATGETASGESHAWVETWTGDWWAHDPTNDVPVGERHITVARGRDYSDVSPARGIFSGGATSQLDVTVDITRLR
jgi:transglutaminase-like putative cysteine protease